MKEELGMLLGLEAGIQVGIEDLLVGVWKEVFIGLGFKRPFSLEVVEVGEGGEFEGVDEAVLGKRLFRRDGQLLEID